MTTSAELAQKAVGFYKDGQNISFAPVIRNERFLQAIKFFRQAQQPGISDDQWTTLEYNIAMTYLRMDATMSRVDDRYRAFGEGLQHFSMAFCRGQKRDLNWLLKLEESAKVYVDQIMEASSYNFYIQLGFTRKLVSFINWPELASYFHESLAEKTINKAVTLADNNEHGKALSILEDCTLNIYEVKDAEVVQELEERREVSIAIYRSVMLRMKTDASIETHLFNCEFLDMDAVLRDVDNYKEAILLSRGKDIECECVGLTRLGKVFEKILKIRTKAREYFHNAVIMAPSLHPRDVSSMPWYQYATEALRRFQLEDNIEQEKEKEKKKAPILIELKDILAEIDKQSTLSAEKLLEHLYKTHIPKDPTAKYTAPAKDNKASLKKAVQRAIVHYHPDKQTQHDLKWQVLCDEITKRLNSHYNRLKSE